MQEVPGSNPGGPTRSAALLSSFLLTFVASSGFAADFPFTPTQARQGFVLHLTGPNAAVHARFRGKTIELYPSEQHPSEQHANGNAGSEADGGNRHGLMPVSVLTPPGIYRLEWLDASGTVLNSVPVPVRSSHFRTQNVVLSPGLSQLHASDDERRDVAGFFASTARQQFWHEPLQKPVPGCTTSPFGVMRLHNGKPTGDYHAGLDQRGAEGTPIYAVSGGLVKLARPFPLRGGTVAIDHGQGLKSMYLHMSRIAAVEGKQVAAGDVIGYVGSTGRSTAPHLHWSLYANGDAIDPNQWLAFVPCEPAPNERKKPAR